MITIYDSVEGVLVQRNAATPISNATIWIDLYKPSKEEDLLVEQALGISVPTREEMSEIEASSRLYQEGGAHVMTAIVLSLTEKDIEAQAMAAGGGDMKVLLRDISAPIASPAR